MDSVTSFSIFRAWRRADRELSHSYFPLTGSYICAPIAIKGSVNVTSSFVSPKKMAGCPNRCVRAYAGSRATWGRARALQTRCRRRNRPILDAGSNSDWPTRPISKMLIIISTLFLSILSFPHHGQVCNGGLEFAFNVAPQVIQTGDIVSVVLGRQLFGC